MPKVFICEGSGCACGAATGAGAGGGADTAALAAG